MTLGIDVEKRLSHGPEGFSLSVKFDSTGRITAFFGRSGAGKSTLVNLIAGLLKPDRGRIAVDGEVLFDSAARINVPVHKRRVGYVFQEGRLFPHYSVRGNLLYGRRFTPSRQRWGSLDEIAELLGIGHLLDRRPPGLSGGEKQRVAIGRALLASPRLLLMDEPLASLDDERKGEILPFIEKLRDRMRIPIVYVSHSVDEVSRIADTVVMLKGGRVTAIGPVNEVFAMRDPQGDAGEPGVVVSARVVENDAAKGVTRLAHPAGTLSVPLANLPIGTSARIRIRARDVALAVGDPGRISIRNRLAATVSALHPEQGGSVAVRLDISGDPLVANVTQDAVHDLGLSAGVAVTALIKSAAFDPLSVGTAERASFP